MFVEIELDLCEISKPTFHFAKKRAKATCYFVRSTKASGDKAKLLHLCLGSGVCVIVLRERRSGKA